MIRIDKVAEKLVDPAPFVGPINHTLHAKIDVSTLTTFEVDSDGYLKPGVPFLVSGALVSGASQLIHGVSIGGEQIVAANPTNTTLGADTSDPLVALAVIGVVNRDLAEDILGRAYSANELSAFGAAGCLIKLTTT